MGSSVKSSIFPMSAFVLSASYVRCSTARRRFLLSNSSYFTKHTDFSVYLSLLVFNFWRVPVHAVKAVPFSCCFRVVGQDLGVASRFVMDLDPMRKSAIKFNSTASEVVALVGSLTPARKIMNVLAQTDEHCAYFKSKVSGQKRCGQSPCTVEICTSMCKLPSPVKMWWLLSCLWKRGLSS